MTEDAEWAVAERRANFRQLEACTADFHTFHASGAGYSGFVECSACGGKVTRLAGNFYYYGLKAGFDAAARIAQQEASDIKALRQRMQAEFKS